TLNIFKDSQKKVIPIVLSLTQFNSEDDKAKLEESCFVNITYNEFYTKLKKNLKEVNGNSKYKGFLNDYMSSLLKLTETSESTSSQSYLSKLEKLQEIFTKYKPKIYQNKVLYFDFETKNYTKNYTWSIDALINENGWTIELFGRNPQSTLKLFKKYIEYVKNNSLGNVVFNDTCERIVYKTLDQNTEISDVQESIKKLIDIVKDLI
ncbi:MAG: hypothetical protein GX116_07975, partial [Fibrobacter sp.]|nr:hypothetical protein [Fibrobacter sp.]